MKGEWRGQTLLNSQPVAEISALLSDQIEIKPRRLRVNLGQVFQGSIPVGNGFILSKEKQMKCLSKTLVTVKLYFHT